MSYDKQKLQLANRAVLNRIQDALTILIENKPNDKSEQDRRYAVLITDIEWQVAYIRNFLDGAYVQRPEPAEPGDML